MKFPLHAISLSVSLLLVSCGASRWTEAEKSSLSSLAVPPATMEADAYAKPIGNEQFSAPYVATGGGSFASGAAAGAAAQLVMEIAAAVQQKQFESRYADAITRASGTLPKDLSMRIRRATAKRFGEQPFFKGKIRDDSPNRFSVIIENYRYIRAGDDGDEVLMRPAFSGRFELTNGSGKKLLSRKFTAAAQSVARPITAFANDRSLVSNAFDEAIANVALQAVNAVNAKLGEAEFAPGVGASSSSGGEPVQLANVNGLAATCNSPYKLTQTCNIWTGASKTVTVGGQKLKIAGSADGRVVLVREGKMISTARVSSTGSAQYDAVKRALRASGVKILRQRDLMAVDRPVGFFLELDGDGYSVLSRGT